MDEAAMTVDPDEELADGQDQRLMKLLRETASKLGRKGAARLLDVDHRTVSACLESGQLSRRVERALERLVEQERIEGVASRVGALEQMAQELRDAVGGLPEMLETDLWLSLKRV